MDGKSLNITEEKFNKLKKIIPEAFTEGKIDWEKLKAALGDDIEFKNERYVLNWAGKSDAFRVLQSPTTATLVPDKEESVNFDTTENIFIEGENLEVLKVLQKSYFGKIKMIYIDPPYNTGNDNFIYPDKFSETKEEYLSRIGDKDETGFMTREGLFRKNSRDSGHYHSNWLSMMYPRLFLARNLLRDDGVIFISIGDEEIHNLKLLMNEVFGEDNFEGHIHWRRRHNQPNDPTKMIGLVAEHILVYSKNHNYLKDKGVGKIGLTGKFSNPDKDIRGDWASKPWKVGAGQSGSKYKIITQSGVEYNEEWMGEESTYIALLKDKRIIFPDNGKGQPRKKYFKFERAEEGQCATNWWQHDVFGHNQEGNDEIYKLFGKKNVFSNPKPSKLIKHLVMIANCNESDIILDFFAGASTTASAVLQSSLGRNFILVQLPEILNPKDKDQKDGYEFCKDVNKPTNIAEIGKERIRRVIKKINEEQGGKLDLDGNADKQDLGFKVFKLQDSNFKIWRTKIENEDQLVEQLQHHLEPLDENAETENVLYELLLKSGIPLTAKIEKKSGFDLVNDNEIALILEKVNNKIIKAVIDAKPQKVITIDRLFNNNDQLKTNTALQMKNAGIEFKVV